ncbi:MAG: sensor histidine kinase [Verrucomicrobiaceae bacterium]|nr:sensor histidine kinase [Verrucomicrobiaceae bacterium]
MRPEWGMQQVVTPTIQQPAERAGEWPWTRLGQRMTQAMRRQKPALVAFCTALLTVAMGWLDHQTTWEVSLFVFYAVPVIIAVWWAGSAAGIFITILSGVIWWLANLETHPYETMLGYLWATLSRVVFFAVVGYAATSVRNKQEADAARIQALEERRQLEADIVAVSEHEQQRIGQDLHDGLCQHLAAIGLAARSLADDLRTQHLTSAQDAELIQQSIYEAVREARGMARGIFPVHVDHHGLAVALSDLAANTTRLTGIQIEVTEEGETQISPPEAAMHLYRIAQEAVANAVRHGGAQEVKIHLQGEPGFILLDVVDNGKGIQIDQQSGPQQGMGLRTMRYRAQMMGAAFQINNLPTRGTHIRCAVPVTRV